MDLYAIPLRRHAGRIARRTELKGNRPVTLMLTPELTMDILFGEPALYPRQKELCDAAFRGERDGYDLIHWAKSMNVSSLRQRCTTTAGRCVRGGASPPLGRPAPRPPARF